MLKRFMLKGTLTSLAFALFTTAQVVADPVRRIELPAGELVAALEALAKQADIELVYQAERLKGIRTAGLTGTYDPKEAVSLLIKGTTLVLRTDQATGVMMISFTNEPTEKSGGNFPADLRLVQSEAESQVFGAANSEESSSEDSSTDKVQEVIVTASRREQRIQDVPTTLQVLNGADLEKQGVSGFTDYLTTVPGVGLRTTGNGTARITIRGISNIGGIDSGWGTTTTTGLYLNDVAIQGTDIPPDMALYDLDRIEVLKGPQGTLYGEGAMGGAIKMVLKAPDLKNFNGKVDASFGSTEHGGDNYGVRAALNAPLVTDRVAMRVVGTYSEEGGFVDNIARGERNQDGKRDYSVRAILAAQLTDALSAEIMGLKNFRKMNDYPQAEGRTGYHASFVEDRYNEVDSRLLALTLKQNFGFAELSSVTAKLDLDRDFLERIPFGRFFFSDFGPVTQDPFIYQSNLESFSQELRLVSQGDRRLDWVFGLFYRDKEQRTPNIGFFAPDDLPVINANLAAASLPQLPADGRYFDSAVHQTYEQYAVYGEGSLELGRGFELTAGLRWYDETVENDIPQTGYGYVQFFTTHTFLPPIKETGIIPKAALSYKLSDNNLLYVQAVKGFRAGAGNANFAIAGDEGADSDSLWSYEIGSKNGFADGRVVLNAAAFYLDWKDMQATALARNRFGGALIGVTDNAGDAELYGFEAELTASAMNSLIVGAAVGYTHSELTSSLGNYLVGAKLPGTPEWTISGYGRYSIPTALGEAFVRFDVRYAGQQTSKLVAADPAGNITYDGTPLEAHTLGNLRLGIERNNGWGVSLFVDNVWDERAILGAGFDSGTTIGYPELYTLERPRTYGITLSASF